MAENPQIRIRKMLGYPTQKGFAEKLGISQQAVSQAERRRIPPETYVAQILDKHPEMKQEILDLLEGGLHIGGDQQDEDLGSVKKDWEPLQYEPIEREAWPWALKFRNQCILDRLGSTASRNGFHCERINDGVKLRKRREEDPRKELQDALFPRPRSFGLKQSGTVLVIGAAYRHYLAREIFKEMANRINQDLRIREFSKNPRYPFYFGYQTVLKYLFVNGTYYRPSRYVDDRGIYYEDFGVILNGRLDRILPKGEQPFGRDASRLILVAGLHRLATGVGVHLLENDALRTAAGAEDHDFESDRRMGGVVYRVVVHYDGRRYENRHDGWRSTVEELEVLHAFEGEHDG